MAQSLLSRSTQSLSPLRALPFRLASASPAPVPTSAPSPRYAESRRRLVAKASSFTGGEEQGGLLRPAPQVESDLNWALARLGVTPLGRAYRLPPVRTLLMHTPKVDSHKAALMPPPHPTSIHPLDLSLPPALAQWRKLMAAVTRHLSESPSLYVEEGGLGSRPSSSQVRAVTTSPAAALLLRLALHRLPTTSVDHYWHDIVLFHAPDLTLDRPRYGLSGSGGVRVQALIRGSDLLTLQPLPPQTASPSDLAQRRTLVLLLTGAEDPQNLLDALLAAHSTLVGPLLPLSLLAQGPHSLLVTEHPSSAPSPLSSPDLRPLLYAQGSLTPLSQGTLAPTWAHLAAPPSLSEWGGVASPQTAYLPLGPRPPHAPAPRAHLILMRDETGALPPASLLGPKTQLKLSPSTPPSLASLPHIALNLATLHPLRAALDRLLLAQEGGPAPELPSLGLRPLPALAPYNPPAPATLTALAQRLGLSQ